MSVQKNAPLRVLIVGHLISGEATGEGYVAFKLTEALSEIADVTLATLQSPRHRPLAEQLPNTRVVSFKQPQLFHKTRTFRELIKPELFAYRRALRNFLAAEAPRFDIAHQLMPAAMRHVSPLVDSALPYAIGPFGGTLPTPEAFRGETGSSAPWFARLRDLDPILLRYSRKLRRSHSKAAMILGVAPYVHDILNEADLSAQSYANFMKLGISELPTEQTQRSRAVGDPLRLVHVGRGVRTKGLRDLIRALHLLKDDSRFHLESAGGGAEIELCKAEAARLGVSDRITFHGRIPRDAVESLYQRNDVFAFPSFREPAGAVFFEAMRWALPVVTARAGGADAIIDESCGIKVDVRDPDQYARDIAQALLSLADHPDLYASLSEGARRKVSDALWSNRAAELLPLYYQALNRNPPQLADSLV